MPSIDAIIVEVGKQLRSATSFVAIFGPLPSGDQAAKKSALRKQFAYLAHSVHPDHASKGSEKEAAEVFRTLNKIRQAAEKAIEQNTYEQQFKPGTGPVLDSDESSDSEIQSAGSSYRLPKDSFQHGDFSVLYKGRMKSGDSVIVKISSEPAYNSWLEREALVLGQFRDAKATDPLSNIKPFVPALLDTFLIGGDGGTRYRVNVMSYVPDLVSVAEVMKAYPMGLDPKDAAWIFRRVLAQTLAASMAGLVHGALVPDHVLIDPFKHEPTHIGWGHAFKRDGKSRITHVVNRWKDYYPPEVFEKKPCGHGSDIYMAGKIMIGLLGGDVRKNKLPLLPKSVAGIILSCVESSRSRRPKDAREVLDGFTRAIRDEWGRAYRVLNMPVR